jgi:hypothetical protein
VQRVHGVLKPVQSSRSAFQAKRIDNAVSLALLLLFKNENVEEANRLVLAFCHRDPLTEYKGQRVLKTRCEALYRIALLGRTRQLLTKEAREATEDHAREAQSPKP